MVDLLHDDIKAAMAFDGLLPPESASFAGQAGTSRPLAYQNAPERLLHRFPSQGPQVPPPAPLSCGARERRARRGQRRLVEPGHGGQPRRQRHPERSRQLRSLTVPAARNRRTERYGSTGRTRLPGRFPFQRPAPGRRCTRDFQSARVAPGAAAETTIPQSRFPIRTCKY